jgi:hypothetical protein
MLRCLGDFQALSLAKFDTVLKVPKEEPQPLQLCNVVQILDHQHLRPVSALQRQRVAIVLAKEHSSMHVHRPLKHCDGFGLE